MLSPGGDFLSDFSGETISTISELSNWLRKSWYAVSVHRQWLEGRSVQIGVIEFFMLLYVCSGIVSKWSRFKDSWIDELVNRLIEE